MNRSFYDMAEYYDLAFSRDVSKESRFLLRCFETLGKVPVKRILEPACGSGIYLLEFARQGYEISGYDYNSRMVDYAQILIEKEGFALKASVCRGDMRTAVFHPPFDGALNLINSLGHCVSDSDLKAHLNCMFQSLKPEAIYVVEFTCAFSSVEAERAYDKNHSWIDEKDGVRMTTTWHPEEYDFKNKIRRVISKIQVEDSVRGEDFSFAEEQKLRLWFFEDFKQISEETGFDLAGVFDQNENPVDFQGGITGERGPLYYALKRQK